MRRIALLLTWSLLVWTFGPQTLEAQQTGTVQGRVVTESGQSLAGAQVSVEGTGLGGLTNSSGRYLILNVPTGEHTITVQSMGYAEATANVTVQAGEVTTQNFRVGQEAVALEELTVSVGSRAAHTAADELPVPVDVYPETQLQASNQVDFLGTIMEVAPSIWVPQEQISDLASGMRPFQMRGMSPDQSLVLIDGMRRHQTASVMVFGSSMPGSSGVDMNSIPMMAVGQLEILRDGASAQYGSDAMAGVLNLQLKDNVSPLSVTAQTGKYFPEWFPSDGWKGRIGANWGFEFLGGVLNITGEYARRNLTNRAGPSSRDQVVAGDADELGQLDDDPIWEVATKNNPVTQPTFYIADGPYENEMLWANYERPIGEDGDHNMQLLATYSDRNDQTTCFRRRGLSGRNWKSIYPNGFMPVFDQDTRDLQFLAGIEGEVSDWNYQIQGNYSENRLDNTMTNTLNASLGPSVTEALAPGEDGVLGTGDDPGLANAHKFYAGSLKNAQYIANAQATREFDVGMSSPLTFTGGLQFRAMNYQILPGVKGSWINGFHPNQTGGDAASGAQCFSGWRGPLAEQLEQGNSDATDDWRTNIGAFVEGEVNLSESFLVNAAARFENYSDFGSTVTGKLAARFQPAEQFIIRGSASTGFRAPTLGQKNWTHVSTSFNDTPGGGQVAVEVGEFPPDHPASVALGAVPLTEETSVNLAGGIAVTPFNNFNLTLDGYWIDVSDAIILSESLEGDAVQEVLAGEGLQVTEVKYMTNVLDLRHKGVTATANYRWLMAEEMFLEFNYNHTFQSTEVTETAPTPQVLRDAGTQLFSAGQLDEIENERPGNKANASVIYRWGPFRGTAWLNHYGSTTTLIDEEQGTTHDWEAKQTIDLEASWRFDNGLRWSVGAENVTDVMPEINPDLASTNAAGQAPSAFDNIFWNGAAGFPWVNGRYLFTSISFQLQ